MSITANTQSGKQSKRSRLACLFGLAFLVSGTVFSADSHYLRIYDHTPGVLLPAASAHGWFNAIDSVSPSTWGLVSSSSLALGLPNSPPSYYWQSNDPLYAGSSMMNAAFGDDGSIYLMDRKGMTIYRADGTAWPIGAASLTRTRGWGSNTSGFGSFGTAFGNGSLYTVATNGTQTSIVRFILGAPGTATTEVATTISFGTAMVTESFGGMAYGDGALWLFERIGDGKMTPKLWRIDPSTMVASPRNVSFSGPVGAFPPGNGLAYHNGTLYLMDGTRIIWFSPNGGAYSGYTTLGWAGTRHVIGGTNYGYRGIGIGFAPIPPTVTMTVTDANGAEGGNNGMSVQFTRTGTTSGDLEVCYSISPSTWRDDITELAGVGLVIRIPNGASSVTLPIGVIDDALNEGTESFTVSLIPHIKNSMNYTIGSPASGTLTVTDDDTKSTVTLTASDSSGTEGADGAAFTISVTPVHPTNLTVYLGAPTGSAASGNDYTALPASVVVPANTPSFIVPVAVINDTAYESTETVQVALASNAAYLLGSPSSASVSIIDNDKPSISITATDASATEGGDTATFTISRGNAINTPLTVKLAASGGTATSGDYSGLPVTITIPANSTTVAVPLSAVDDTVAELPETVVVAIVTDPLYNIGSPASATVTIYDNEAPVVTVAASDASAKEGGTDNGRFTLTRLGSRAVALTVTLGRTGSAGAGSDYTAIPATAAIGINTNTVDVSVTVSEDTTPETDETVIVTVQGGTGYAVGTPSSATVTIADNETPTLSIAATDATAAEQGLSTGTFTITRLGTKSTALTVNLSLAGSSATNGTDFDTIASTLALGANVVSTTITVKPKEDIAFEPTESVICAIVSGTGYALGTPTTARVDITDNDTQTITIVATTPNAAEPSTNGAFVVRRSGQIAAALTVQYTIATGTGRAINGTDYATIPTSVTIAANATDSAPIPITVTDDSSYEGPETVQLTISSNSSYVIGSPSVATVTIADNDKPTVTASLIDGNAAEPSDIGRFRLTRSGILSLGSLTVKYQMSGRAINGTDYSLLSGTATIAQNSATADVTLTPLPDELIEGIETAILTISTDPTYNVGSPSVATVSIGSSVIDTIAGQGPAAYTSTPIMGGQATATGLGTPTGLAVDAAGNRFVADGDANAVLKINASGVISRFAGNASWTPGFGGDAGQAASATLNNPRGVAVDAAGNVYIADTNNHRVRKVTATTGVITTIAGRGAPRFSGDGGAATSAYLNNPQAVAVDAAGNVYIADMANQRVRKITVSTGVITTVAGNGTAGFAGDGAAATAAQINNPRSVAVDASGNLYIADTVNNRIRKVTVSTGVISTIAGNGTGGYAGDNGAATTAQINAPEGVAISEFGEVFIADTANNRVRKIEGTTILTVAGNGLEGWTGDGGRATSASMFQPVGLAFDATGNLFVADSWNSSIRRLRAGVSAIAFLRRSQGEVLLATAWAPGPEPR